MPKKHTLSGVEFAVSKKDTHRALKY